MNIIKTKLITIGIFILSFCLIYCNQQPKTIIKPWVPYDEAEEIAENANQGSIKLRYKLIQSKNLDKNKVWNNISKQIENFSEQEYQSLTPFILDQDIPTVQNNIRRKKITYEKLTQWYLYRIVKYENDKNKFLNAIIDINPNAVSEAKLKDENISSFDHPIFGIPILVKDNINVDGLATTAGSLVFKNNKTTDAFIIKRIKENGGIILGKTNLSEWANYLCLDCPNGYSAIGGQTLNPYGRKIFDTGGSSSGSGVAVATNYSAVAIGTETSGSILSPSSKNSLVGLKPTVGLLSRSGIVPISSTLDTPGPMTKNVIDNAILLSAMSGKDTTDITSNSYSKKNPFWKNLDSNSLKDFRFGVNKNFLDDSLYNLTMKKIVELGGKVFEFEPEQIEFKGFGKLLSADMKNDLPNYINKFGSDKILHKTISEIVNYNKEDSLTRIPYGQARFEGILSTNLNKKELEKLKAKLENEGKRFFDNPMKKYKLDFVLSINNRNAGYAATAKYPCLTVPMGYYSSGEPGGITFISKPYKELELLKVGYAFEQSTKIRISPKL